MNTPIQNQNLKSNGDITVYQDFLVQARDGKWGMCSVPAMSALDANLPKFILYYAHTVIKVEGDIGTLLKSIDGKWDVPEDLSKVAYAKRIVGFPGVNLPAMLVAAAGGRGWLMTLIANNKICFAFGNTDTGFYAGPSAEFFTEVEWLIPVQVVVKEKEEA